MNNKKVYYESKGAGSVGGGGTGGFVRRLTGGIFSPSSRSLLASDSAQHVGVGFGFGLGHHQSTEGRWRPRKKEFERLDEGGDEDSFLHDFHHGDNNTNITTRDVLTAAKPAMTTKNPNPDTAAAATTTATQHHHWTIKNVFSTESEAHEYKRDLMYEKKRKIIWKQTEASTKTQKHDWSSFSIKPSKRDGGGDANAVINSPSKKATLAMTPSMGSGNSGAISMSGRKKVGETFPSLTLASSQSHVDGFGFQQHTQQHRDDNDHEDVEDEMSRQTSSTRHTFCHPSHQTVTSDPTDFFSKEASIKLTKNNITRMETLDQRPVGSGASNGNNTIKKANENIFYQFALDNDRESTVVESSVELKMSYSHDEDKGVEYKSDDDDDITEVSDGVASTQIQVRVPKPTMSVMKSQSFFPNTKDQDNSKANTADGDDWFASFKADYDSFACPARPDPRSHYHSTQSLAYSPSPVDRTVTRSHSETKVDNRDHIRSPLSPLNYFKSVHSKNENTPSRQRHYPLVPSSARGDNSGGKKPDPAEAWIGFKSTSKFGQNAKVPIPRPDPVQSFDPFDSNHDLSNPDTYTKKETIKSSQKKRDPSISQIVDERFCLKSKEEEKGKSFHAFESNDPARDYIQETNAQVKPKVIGGDAWELCDMSVKDEVDMGDNGSRKENSSTLVNRHAQHVINNTSNTRDAFRTAPVTAVPSSDLVPKYRQPLFRGDSEDFDYDNESATDGDSFDSVPLWERSQDAIQSKPIGIYNFASSGRMMPKKIVEEDEFDHIDTKSNSSKRSSNAGGSYNKPFGLPSNAIMASMLFQKHYNIDQTDVENKLKAKEEEHSKDRTSRNGDIPDSVHADHEHMTTVSSFSDATPTAFSDAWQRPSRDLLSYYSSARTLDMDSKSYLIQSQSMRSVSNSALYEA